MDELGGHCGCNSVIPGGFEVQGLGKGPPGGRAGKHSLTGRTRRASNQFFCAGTLFCKRFYTLQTRVRVARVVGATIDALGGGVKAYTAHLLWHSWFCEALEAGISFRCVSGVATYGSIGGWAGP